MKKMSIYKKCFAAVLSAVLVLTMTGCDKTEANSGTAVPTEETATEQPVYTATPGEVKKSETVYININNDGSVSDISVTDWVHTDKGEVCVNDVSSLENIESIKDDTIPVNSKDGIQWNMTGTDLYYSGTTEKTPPVQIGLDYYLDGKKINPDELAGKSGKVKIELNMKNTLYKEYEIDGEKQKIYLPVLVIGGFILPESEFSGVEVTNGRAIGDGQKQIAVMMGIPGMSESLGISDLDIDELDDLMFGDTACVTADAENFELSNMYFAAVPLSSLNIELDTGDSAEDLKEILAAVEQVQSLLSGMDTDTIISLLTDSEGTNELTDVINEAVTLYNDNKPLIDILAKYSTEENVEQLKKLVEFITDEDTLKAIEILSSSEVINFFTDLSELSDSIPLVTQIVADLQSPEVQEAINNLPETIEKLEDIKTTLSENKDTVDYIIGLLSDDNIGKITELVNTIAGLDLESMEEKYSSLTANAGTVISRCEKWIEFGREYKIFTDAADNMETSVLFIYMTPSISAEEEETDTSSSSSSGESALDTIRKNFE